MRWTIMTNSKGESGKSVLAGRHDDDETRIGPGKLDIKLSGILGI